MFRQPAENKAIITISQNNEFIKLKITYSDYLVKQFGVSVEHFEKYTKLKPSVKISFLTGDIRSSFQIAKHSKTHKTFLDNLRAIDNKIDTILQEGKKFSCTISKEKLDNGYLNNLLGKQRQDNVLPSKIQEERDRVMDRTRHRSLSHGERYVPSRIA